MCDCDRACSLMISCCGALCRCCCKFATARTAFLSQFLIYSILQGFNVATDAGLYTEIFKTRRHCKNFTDYSIIQCNNKPNGTDIKPIMQDHLKTLEILEYGMMLVMGVGAAIFIVHVIVLLPNLIKNFKDHDLENEVKVKEAPLYYQNIVNTHCIFMILETFIHDIPATCLAAEISVHFWGKDDINCWECSGLGEPMPGEKSLWNSTLWMGLMLTGVAFLAVYKGSLPLYFWLGNPFCWSCYPLRFCLALPAGIIFAVMILTPCMGVASLRVIPAVPLLKPQIGGISDTIWQIGLVFWVLLIVGFITYYFCKSTVMDMCPCLSWCEEPKQKDKKDKEVGCLWF